jgi:hypothetical protein
MIQHYVGEVVTPALCRMVSTSDAFTPNGRTRAQVTWTLSVKHVDDRTCEPTRTLSLSWLRTLKGTSWASRSNTYMLDWDFILTMNVSVVLLPCSGRPVRGDCEPRAKIAARAASPPRWVEDLNGGHPEARRERAQAV